MNQKSRFNLFILDWDGTIAKTLDIWLSAYKKLFRQRGLNPSTYEITEKVFGDWQGPQKLGVTDIETYTKELIDEVNRRFIDAPLYHEAYGTIVKLKQQGKKIAIVTSSKRSTVLPIIKKHHLNKLINVFLGKEDVVAYKPNPEAIHKVIELLNVQPNQTIVMGDTDKDIQAGKNAGVTTILFYPKINHKFYRLQKLTQTNPDYIIEHFSQLLEIC